MTRIVAGRAKGRRLAVPENGTRPTSERAREALFSSLDARIRLDGARVLDLYAGTGAVGLEALSRGASKAIFVESRRPALAVLRRNIEAVGLPGTEVVASPVDRYDPAEDDLPFDLVFADPPYGTEVTGLAATIDRGGWLGSRGYLVIEHSVRQELSAVMAGFGNITFVDEKRYGDTAFWYGRAR